MADLARDGLHALQQRMLKATVEAQSPAELVAIQRDLVEGARRLVTALEAELPRQTGYALLDRHRAAEHARALADAGQFYQDARAALRRYERQARLPAGRRAMEAGE